ncbi:hypothetical protein, partial [Paenibacillus sp. TY11]|uniref:hypothetical protein n=1 Tax=Paenibacillus sp. TY11 TaxID=3448633 RepID=UPI0040392A8A
PILIESSLVLYDFLGGIAHPSSVHSPSLEVSSERISNLAAGCSSSQTFSTLPIRNLGLPDVCFGYGTLKGKVTRWI